MGEVTFSSESCAAERIGLQRFDTLSTTARALWAKSGEAGGHSLLCHMLDVAAVAEVILAREPVSTVVWASEAFGFQAQDLVRALAARVGSHDLGKSLPGFQAKWPEGRARLESLGLAFPDKAVLDAKNRHDAAAFDLNAKLLAQLGIEDPSAVEVARALAAHHGRAGGP